MNQSLLAQLGVATAMVSFTVVVHLMGLSLLIAATNRHARRFGTERALKRQALVLVGVAFGLFALHTVEIWSYAVLYHGLGATQSFEDALYFSTVTYATIGYGDLTLPRSWRILGAIEGANGVILLGWSTAFFVSVVGRIRALEHDWSDAVSGEATDPSGLPKRASPHPDPGHRSAVPLARGE